MPKTFGKIRGRFASRERAEATRLIRARAPEALHAYLRAQGAERRTAQRLERFRRDPKHSLGQATQRAGKLLSRSLGRLERIEQRYASMEQLRKQAASLGRQVGWRVVSRLVPHPAYQALRGAERLLRGPTRDQGRGIEL